MCAEIYKMLRAILEKYDYPTAVGDEGGFAPNLPDAKEALHMIMRAIEKAGYKPKEQIVIALDAAASELYDKERKEYVFPGEAKMHGHRVARSTEEMIDYYEELAGEFPIISIEDPLDEEDWEGWELLTTRLGLIKTGAPCRSERIAKYNQLLRIEEKLGNIARYENPFVRFS